MEWFNYLLKVSACLTLFFAFYLVLLRKLTFFKANRFYLLLALIGSFIIPNLQFTVEREVEQVPIVEQSMPLEQVQQLALSNNNAPLVAIERVPVEKTVDWLSLLPWLYLAIVLVLIGVACWRIYKLVKHTRQGTMYLNGLKLVTKTDGFTNCSFFNYVFIDDKNLNGSELEVLLKHEQVHAKQFHSLDKMLMVLAKAVLWFNPIIYLYDKAVEQNHEYEADEVTSTDYGTNPYAQLLLHLAVSNNKIALVHNFVKSPIKERIKMLFNDKSKNMKKLMYLLIIPIGLGLIWGFTIDVIEVFPKQFTQEKEFTLVLDAGHGGKNAGAKFNGVTEKGITLSMAKKIKAIAESKGIKVLLTRSDDEYVEVADRLKVSGSLMLSLHVNSAPSSSRNGLDMFVPGNNNGKDQRFARSQGLTYHLYKNLKNAKGIKINNIPKKQNAIILNSSSMPAVLLELGYLSNQNDLKYITNNQKQDELAKLIVDGIVDYRQKMHSNEEQAKFQKFADDFHVKYTAWKNSETYKFLVAETKNFKSQTLIGNVQSLNYVQKGKIQEMDGFILSANNKLYRVFLDKEQLKKISFNVGDKVSLLAPKAEVWFDSDYPAIKPKNVKITSGVGVVPPKVIPRLISSTGLIADNRNNIFYIKKGKIEIGDHVLEAEEMTWDKNKMIISAKKGTLKVKDGNVLTGESLIYDLKARTYQVNNAVGNVRQVESSVYDLMNKLPYHASDSVRISKTKDIMTLYGKASIDFDGKRLSGDKIEINNYTHVVTAYNAELLGYDTEIVKAEVISYNLNTNKRRFQGVQKN